MRTRLLLPLLFSTLLLAGTLAFAMGTEPPTDPKKAIKVAIAPKTLEKLALELIDRYEESGLFITPERLLNVPLFENKFSNIPLGIPMVRARLHFRRNVYPTPRNLDSLQLPPYYVRDEFRIFIQVGPEMSVNLWPGIVASGNAHISVGHEFVAIHFVDQVGDGYKTDFWKRYRLPWESFKNDTLEDFRQYPVGYAVMASDYMENGATAGLGVGLGGLFNNSFALGLREELGKYRVGTRAVVKPTADRVEVIRENGIGWVGTSAAAVNSSGWFIPYVPFVTYENDRNDYKRKKWLFDLQEKSQASGADFEVLLNRKEDPTSNREPVMTLAASDVRTHSLTVYPYVIPKITNRRGQETLLAQNSDDEQPTKLVHLFWVNQKGQKKITSSELVGDMDLKDTRDLSLNLQIRYLKMTRGLQLKRAIEKLSFLMNTGATTCVFDLVTQKKIPPHELRFNLRLNEKAIEDLRALNPDDFENPIRRLLRQMRDDTELKWPKKLTRLMYRLGRYEKDETLYHLFSKLRPESYSLIVSLQPSVGTDATKNSCITAIEKGKGIVNQPLDEFLGLEQVLKEDAPDHVPSEVRLTGPQSWGN